MSEYPDHVHGPDGHVLNEVHTEAEAEVAATEVAADANVQIAQIESETAIALAKIDAKTEEAHDLTEVEVLRAELRAVKETLATLTAPPEAEPVADPAPPVVVNDVVDEPAESEPPKRDSRPVQADVSEERPAKKSSGLGFW